MEKNIGRLVKKASNQLGREFDQFAKPFDLTGMQMSIIDFLSQGVKEEYFQQDIEKEFNIQRATNGEKGTNLSSSIATGCQTKIRLFNGESSRFSGRMSLLLQKSRKRVGKKLFRRGYCHF